MSAELRSCLSVTLQRLCTGNPPPGGASIAAVSAALAAGLVAMVCRIAARRKSLAEAAALNIDTAQKAEDLAYRLLSLAAKDDEALDQLMQAWRMPRGTEAEQEARRTAIAEASKVALEPPLEIAEGAVEGLRLVTAAWSSTGEVAPSDLATAAELFKAATMAGLYNTSINLASLGGQEVRTAAARIAAVHNDLDTEWASLATRTRNLLVTE